MIRPLWIEIDLRKLRKNLKAIRDYLSKDVKIIATVKQSAYGHGLVPVAKSLSREGIDFFGVGSIEEAISLREDGLNEPILVLSAILDKFVNYFLQYSIIPTIVDLNFARKLDWQAARQNKVVPVHVKIDTGMGRLGLYYKQAHNFVRQLSKFTNLHLEGIYTHFPAADSDPQFTNYQIKAFNNFIEQLKKENIFFKFHHCANSIGIINYPAAHFNMVRPGLIIYGIKPAPNSLNVEPVLALKSKVIFTKKVPKGMSISYCRTYIANKARFIATVAVGYADGYPWSLSNSSQVIIKNSFFKLVGRVCMDHIMIDLKAKSDIKPGQEVILIGKSKDKKISVEDLAGWANTIPYEIISRLCLKIPRIYKQ